MIPVPQPSAVTTSPNMAVIAPPSPTNDDVVTDDGRVIHRVFKDSKQAHAAYRGLKRDNANRNRRNAEIQRKLNNEPPYKPKKLESMGQNWRHNRPTGFISTLISRVKPGYKKTITDSQFLTFSKHPGQGPEADQKTVTFREEITKLLRGWPGFDDFVSSIIHENVVFGYTAATWESDYDWRPTWLRQDEVFFQAEAPKDVNRHALWARVRSYGVHELVPLIEDPLSAEVGYNIKNLIEAVNNAIPPTKFDGDGSDNARRWEDYVREGSLGASFEQEGKFVKLGQVFVMEPHNKVSVYVFTEKDGSEIITMLDAFDSMEQALALFSVEEGSGPLMTSRGAGRDLYNTHVAVDKARNLVWDQFYLSGLLLLKKGQGGTPGAAPLKVMHPVAFVDAGYDVQDVNIAANTDAFFELDRHATAIAEMQIGVFLPGQSSGSDGGARTASEVNYVATVDAQIREGILSRFFFQFIRAVNQIQRRVCHVEHVMEAAKIAAQLEVMKSQMGGVAPEWAPQDVVAAFQDAGLPLPSMFFAYSVPSHLDEAAVRCCVSMLLQKLTAADIILISRSEAQNFAQDTSAQVNQGIQGVAQLYKGDPNVDQVELTRRDIAARVGNDVADVLVIDQEDQTLTAEAVRQQTHELNDMMNGFDVPVSPRDPDDVHLDTIGQKFSPVLQSAETGGMAPLMPAFEKVLQHFDAHVQQFQSKGGDPNKLQKYQAASQQLHQLFNQASKAVPQLPGNQEVPDGAVPAAAVATDAPPGDVASPAPSALQPPASQVSSIAAPIPPPPPQPAEVAAKAQI